MLKRTMKNSNTHAITYSQRHILALPMEEANPCDPGPRKAPLHRSDMRKWSLLKPRQKVDTLALSNDQMLVCQFSPDNLRNCICNDLIGFLLRLKQNPHKIQRCEFHDDRTPVMVARYSCSIRARSSSKADVLNPKDLSAHRTASRKSSSKA